MMDLRKYNPFAKKEIPFSEELFKRKLDEFIDYRTDTSWLTDAGKEALRNDFEEHLANGVTKEALLKDLLNLKRKDLLAKYTIDHRTAEEKKEDDMKTAAVHVKEILYAKGYAGAAIDAVLLKAHAELDQDWEAFTKKLERMSDAELDKNYFN